MITATQDARKLFHDGADALARVEHAGMRIDCDYLDRQIEQIGERISRLEGKLRECDEFKLQQRAFGPRCKLTSRDQLAHVLFKVMGNTPLTFTSGGASGKKRPKLDEVVLEKLGTKYCRGFLRLEKLRKFRSTSLVGIRSKVVDGFLHVSFNLNTVKTYRGSASDPGFHSTPSRDHDMAGIIRRAFIPHDGHVLLEMDLKQNEVRVAGCYTGDEQLIADTLTGDMHRDMAAEIYCLPRDEVPKDVRFQAKGGFVFAQFYGDYWGQIGPKLWDAIGQRGLQTASGVLLDNHLASKGINGLGTIKYPEPGTFIYHVKAIEYDFWNVRYPVYKQWKLDWFEEYLENGFYRMKTGFVCQGVYDSKQVTNGPIQGSAFHCALWILIKLERWLRRKKMRSLVIGHIHDSIEMDVHRDELDDVKAKAKSLLENEIRQAWPWLTVPLAAEAMVGAENWFDKVEVEL